MNPLQVGQLEPVIDTTQYDVMLALTRKIVNGEEEDEAETAVFAQAQDAEAVAEEYLVDDGWKLVDVEPEAV